MNSSKSKSVFLGCLLLALLPCTSLAQDEDPVERARVTERDQQEEARQRQEQEQQKRIDAAREEFVNLEVGRARRSVEYTSISPLRIERDFMGAVPQFRRALTSYRQAVGLDASLKDSLRDMDRLVDLFKDYFKTTRVEAPLLDKGQFNNTPRKQLVSETLATAEHIDRQLRLAVMHMQDANNTNTVSIDTVLFMRELHGNVLRLDLLLSKVK